MIMWGNIIRTFGNKTSLDKEVHLKHQVTIPLVCKFTFTNSIYYNITINILNTLQNEILNVI